MLAPCVSTRATVLLGPASPSNSTSRKRPRRSQPGRGWLRWALLRVGQRMGRPGRAIRSQASGAGGRSRRRRRPACSPRRLCRCAVLSNAVGPFAYTRTARRLSPPSPSSKQLRPGTPPPPPAPLLASRTAPPNWAAGSSGRPPAGARPADGAEARGPWFWSPRAAGAPAGPAGGAQTRTENVAAACFFLSQFCAKKKAAISRPILDLDERQAIDQTLKRKSSTSPSCTTYSLPSERSRPCSRAATSDPACARVEQFFF